MESIEVQLNTVLAAIDEVHLINEWGPDFRTAFNLIGPFLRGRLPITAAVVGLTATLQPGPPTESVCKALGFFPGQFHHIRRSNERVNVQFSLQILTESLSGDRFPFILALLNEGRKTVIHCQALDDVICVFLYLWRVLPKAVLPKGRRIRMYPSVIPAC